MDFIINLVAKFQGWGKVVIDLLPLLGAVGGILATVGAILVRGAAAHDPAGLFHALHPTSEELAALSLSFAVLKAHFNHQANAAKIDTHAETLAKVVPPSNP